MSLIFHYEADGVQRRGDCRLLSAIEGSTGQDWLEM